VRLAGRRFSVNNADYQLAVEFARCRKLTVRGAAGAVHA